jgi:hypothetical protein
MQFTELAKAQKAGHYEQYRRKATCDSVTVRRSLGMAQDVLTGKAIWKKELQKDR